MNFRTTGRLQLSKLELQIYGSSREYYINTGIIWYYGTYIHIYYIVIRAVAVCEHNNKERWVTRNKKRRRFSERQRVFSLAKTPQTTVDEETALCNETNNKTLYFVQYNIIYRVRLTYVPKFVSLITYAFIQNSTFGTFKVY
jgi:hypothetical protein